MIPTAFAVLLLAAIVTLEIVLLQWWHQYKSTAQYEDVAKRYGLKRRKAERLAAWEMRIFAATKEVLLSSDLLTKEAYQRGNVRRFPPGQRPSMPPDVTWTTGIERPFSLGETPYVVWLPNDHPLAVRYRKAKGPDYQDDR